MRRLHVAILLVALVALLSPGQAQSRNHNGMCACPRIYLPVCGSDLKTYSNRCLLNCETETSRGRSIGLRMLREGSCEQEEPIAEIPVEIPN